MSELRDHLRRRSITRGSRGRKRVLDKTERGCKTAPKPKNGGSDEYRSSSADLVGACVWIVERGRSERGPGAGGFGGRRGRRQECRGLPRGAGGRQCRGARPALPGPT